MATLQSRPPLRRLPRLRATNSVIPLLLALLALCTISLLMRDAGKLRLSAVLLGNWLVNSGFCYVSGDPNPWPFYMVVDYLSGLLVFAFCTEKWSRWILATYAAELVAHSAYSISLQSHVSQGNYWIILYCVAWGQVAITGAWVVYDLGRRWLGAHGSVAPAGAGNTAKESSQ